MARSAVTGAVGLAVVVSPICPAREALARGKGRG